MATKIKLSAKDGKEFEVEKEVACLSETVKNLVEGKLRCDVPISRGFRLLNTRDCLIDT